MGDELPCANSSVTTIECMSSSEAGTATFAHARPDPSARKVRAAHRGRSAPYEPQLIGAVRGEGGEAAHREMAASVYGDEDTRARPRPPSSLEDYDPSGTARQRLDLRSGRRPGCAAREFALKDDVPDDEERDERRRCRPPRHAEPARHRRDRRPSSRGAPISRGGPDGSPRGAGRRRGLEASRHHPDDGTVFGDEARARRTRSDVRLDKEALLGLKGPEDVGPEIFDEPLVLRSHGVAPPSSGPMSGRSA